MGELSGLRLSMGVTLFLVGLVFFIFLVVLDIILALAGVFFCNFFILLGFALLFIAIQFAIGPWAIKRSANIDEKAEEMARYNTWLRETVERLCKEAGIPEPRLAVVSNPEPNAFVFGTTRDNTYLVVHDSLLATLTKEEAEAVIAHEIGHLKHKDCVVMTLASSIPLLTYLLARGGFEVMRHYRPRGKKGGGAILVIIAIAAVSYLVYLITQMLVLYLSRSREYYADAHSATATKNPAGLQSALIKIMTGLSLNRDRETPSGLRAFYAMDPVKVEDDAVRYRARMDEFDLNKDGVIDEKELEIAMAREASNPWRSANELFSTHPNIYKRVLMLRQMELEMEATGMAASVEAEEESVEVEEVEMVEDGGVAAAGRWQGRPQTPAERDYQVGPKHMGGGSEDEDASWKD